jgi:hypothetical protein
MNDIAQPSTHMVALFKGMDCFVAFAISSFTCFTIDSMCLVYMASYVGGVKSKLAVDVAFTVAINIGWLATLKATFDS